MDKLVVHAAKIPEAAQSLETAGRRRRGVEMVNACDDKPWVPVPADFPTSEVVRCPVCVYVVNQDRSSKHASS